MADGITIKSFTVPYTHFAERREPLEVTFSEPMTSSDFSSLPTPKGIKICPDIAGKWQWASESTIVFRPFAPWNHRICSKITFPAGLKSEISGREIAGDIVKEIKLGNFYIDEDNQCNIRSSHDPVKVTFSDPVSPDSLKNHLSGFSSLPIITTKDSLDFQICQKNGWPCGDTVTIVIDSLLTAYNGNIPMHDKFSSQFYVNDSLICNGIF